MMPAPNKSKHKEVTKAYVKARLDEGATYKELVRETGVSLGTISNWRNETEQDPQQLERGKRALTLVDYDNLAKATHINGAILDEIVERINNGDLKDIEIKELSRTSVEISKTYGITWDKVLIREGTLSPFQRSTSPEQMILLLLAQAEANRAKADSIRVEKEAYEVMKEQGIIDL
ncbi:MAG: hypothetical protein IH975_05165 [Nitrospinae bacterium]|nr:hypothetical protein [Nitrospinota bacterium]